jgi:NAD(P)-dependent dehydrogenase (short-subunit alcohol dehydrogenase family)
VSSWSDVLNIFTKTWDTFGSIDVVISNAGVNQFESILDESLTEDGLPTEPSMKSLQVNLHAAAYCARAALHFFKKQPEKKCQLVFTGSAASILDTPPLFLYCAGKHGVLGLMRGMRLGLPSDKITVNMIAPWMTVSPMLPDWIRQKWGDLPANTPDGVAKALLLPALRPEMNGKTLWVAGDDIVEVEDALYETRPQWLGKELSKHVDEGQKAMNIG